MADAWGKVTGKPWYAKEPFHRSLQRKWAMKIGRIESLLQSPCSGDVPGGEPTKMLLWVAAFFAGIPEAIVTLNRHDCSDNLWDKNKQLWAPIGRGRGGRHGRRGTPSNRGGEALPSSGKQARGWQQGIFNLGNFLEKVGAKLMIIDAALDLGINWQSNFLEWTGCGAPPPIYTTATVARDVVGWGLAPVRNDMIGHAGSVGVICGIGGFATTVPAGQLEFAGSVGDRPFLFVPYETLAGTFWVVDGTGGQPSPQLDQTAGTAEGEGGIGNVHSTRASMNTLGAGMRTGSLWIERPFGPDTACQVDPHNICTIMGQNEGLLTADPKADPCSNMPLTGTAPKAR